MAFLHNLQNADVNECAENTFECPRDTTCKNILGSYTCVCGTGYTFNPDSSSCTGM